MPLLDELMRLSFHNSSNACPLKGYHLVSAVSYGVKCATILKLLFIYITYHIADSLSMMGND